MSLVILLCLCHISSFVVLLRSLSVRLLLFHDRYSYVCASFCKHLRRLVLLCFVDVHVLNCLLIFFLFCMCLSFAISPLWLLTCLHLMFCLSSHVQCLHVLLYTFLVGRYGASPCSGSPRISFGHAFLCMFSLHCLYVYV